MDQHQQMKNVFGKSKFRKSDYGNNDRGSDLPNYNDRDPDIIEIDNCDEKETESESKRPEYIDQLVVEQIFPCLVCHKTFPKRLSLLRHLKTVHESKKDAFPCPSCKKTFAQPAYLKAHAERVHLKIKYQCNICAKSYVMKESLRAHLKRHESGENNFRSRAISQEFRSFKCVHPGCGKVFTELNNLTLHMRTHSNDIGIERSSTTTSSVDQQFTDAAPSKSTIMTAFQKNITGRNNGQEVEIRKIKLEEIDLHDHEADCSNRTSGIEDDHSLEVHGEVKIEYVIPDNII